MSMRTQKTRRRATVGHISVPELPGYWPGRDGVDTRAMDLLRERDDVAYCDKCHRRAHLNQTCEELAEYCEQPSLDQYP